jgi:hypothetical protein
MIPPQNELLGDYTSVGDSDETGLALKQGAKYVLSS